VTANKHLTSI